MHLQKTALSSKYLYIMNRVSVGTDIETQKNVFKLVSEMKKEANKKIINTLAANNKINICCT